MDELKAKPIEEMNEKELKFFNMYEFSLPLGTGKCVMNSICEKFEKRFDSIESRRLNKDFDYTIFRSDAEYTDTQYKAIKNLYAEYNQRIQSYVTFQQYEKVDSIDAANTVRMIRDEFVAACSKICPDRKALCNAVLDITYKSESTKSFAWDICGDEIIENLFDRFGYNFSFPVLSDEGDIYYCGYKYDLCEMELEGDQWLYH